MSHELNLKSITLSRYFFFTESYPQYKQEIVSILYLMKKYIPEGTALEEHGGQFIEEVAQQFSERYITFGNTSGKKKKVWYDLLEDFRITPIEQGFYGRMMLYHLQNLSLHLFDTFLDYHLQYHFNDDEKKFFRFLNLTLRENQDGIISQEATETIQEWINEKKSTEKTIEARTKGKKIRLADDDGTCLTQEQTTLLISYLQRLRIIRSEENLRNKEAGEAFSMLTGYSAETIRQTLSKAELKRIASKENLKKLDAILTKLTIEINNDRTQKK